MNNEEKIKIISEKIKDCYTEIGKLELERRDLKYTTILNKFGWDHKSFIVCEKYRDKGKIVQINSFDYWLIGNVVKKDGTVGFKKLNIYNPEDWILYKK